MSKKKKIIRKSNRTSQNKASTLLLANPVDLTEILESLDINPDYFYPSYWLDKSLNFITNSFSALSKNKLGQPKKLLPYKSNPQGIQRYTEGYSNKKLAEGRYPYANTTPYDPKNNKKARQAYDMRGVTTRPIITYLQYEDLLNDTTGKVIRFDNVPYFLKTVLKNTGGENNNPCNISIPLNRELVIGAVGAQNMADGQAAGKFDNIVNGVATTMRLYRELYGRRNFPLMNNGMLGRYHRDEPIGLTALRLHYVTNKCKLLGIEPNSIIDTDDKWTLCSFVNAMALSETGSTLSRETLDKAYKVAFGE